LDEVSIMPSTEPKVLSVEVVPARPTEADHKMIAQLSAETKRAMPETAYIVKIGLETIPPPTARGWALYVGDTRIPKYWEYSGGIYVKVLDERFLEEHKGEELRFSENGTHFVDTGVKLPGASIRRGRRGTDIRSLPLQSQVLEESAPARKIHGRAPRKALKGARPAGAKATSGARKRRKSR
jgi:hypothetical protein